MKFSLRGYFNANSEGLSRRARDALPLFEGARRQMLCLRSRRTFYANVVRTNLAHREMDWMCFIHDSLKFVKLMKLWASQSSNFLISPCLESGDLKFSATTAATVHNISCTNWHSNQLDKWLDGKVRSGARLGCFEYSNGSAVGKNHMFVEHEFVVRISISAEISQN